VHEPVGFRHSAPVDPNIGNEAALTQDPGRGRKSHERWVINKVRALGSWYTKGLDNGSHLRTGLNSAESLDQLRDGICGFFSSPAAREASSVNCDVATASELLI
jgi:hypothetical protein